MIASPDPKFSDGKQPDQLRRRLGQQAGDRDANPKWQGKVDGFVLDANSGEPIANVRYPELGSAKTTNCPTAPRARPTRTASSRSMDRIRGASSCSRRWKDQQLSTRRFLPVSNQFRPAARPRKRSSSPIGRSTAPARPIQFKGICIDVDQQSDDYHTLANRAVTVIFQDPNGKEIVAAARQDQRLRLVQRQLHRAARPADGQHDASAPRANRTARRASTSKNTSGRNSRSRSKRRRTLPSSTATSVCKAKRPPTPARPSAGEGPLPRRARDSLPDLVGLLLLVAAAEHRTARKSPTERLSPLPTAPSRSNSPPSPTCPCRKRTSRRSTSTSPPT